MCGWSEPIQIEEFMNQFENGARESCLSLAWLDCLFCGLWAAASRTATSPQKRRASQGKRVNWFVSEWMKWNEMNKFNVWNGMKNLNLWMTMEWNEWTPPQAAQGQRGKPTTTPIQLSLWRSWMELLAEGLVLAALAFSLSGWLWAVAPPIAPLKGEDESRQSSPLISFLY